MLPKLLTVLLFLLNVRGKLRLKKLYTICAQVLNTKNEMEHVSVLKEEVISYLQLAQGNRVVDATLGYAGHSLEILKRIGKEGELLVFEQDERNLKVARERLKEYESQIVYFHDNFRYLKERVTGSVDAILFDLGLSSPHVDDAERGFSFMKEGPLDMRFDQRTKLTAADIVNTYSEEDMSRIFFVYGEERLARKIAGSICRRRLQKPFETTVDLAEHIERVVPKKRNAKASAAHPATRVFQALRIEVNDELEVLKDVLLQAAEILAVGGRIVIIAYHSLEDRIVKQFFKSLLQPPASVESSVYRNYDEPIFESLSKKPVIPSADELAANPRSRSAKLRAYKKLLELPSSLIPSYAPVSHKSRKRIQ